MTRIQSKLHKIGTCDVCKISLSCFDDKRYKLDDGINKLAYFHKDIKKSMESDTVDNINNIFKIDKVINIFKIV